MDNLNVDQIILSTNPLSLPLGAKFALCNQMFVLCHDLHIQALCLHGYYVCDWRCRLFIKLEGDEMAKKPCLLDKNNKINSHQRTVQNLFKEHVQSCLDTLGKGLVPTTDLS